MNLLRTALATVAIFCLVFAIRELTTPSDEERQGQAFWDCAVKYSIAHTRADSERVGVHLPGLGPGDLTCGSLLHSFPGAMRSASLRVRPPHQQSVAPPKRLQPHQPTSAALTAYARGEMFKDRGEWDKAAIMFDSSLALDSGYQEACFELQRLRPSQRC